MKKKKILFALCFIAQITLPFNIAYASPASPSTPIIPCSTNPEEGIMPYANVTGYQYMEVNGVLFKRLWSYTYARWEEPYWTVA